MTGEIEQARIDLAAAFRLAARFGLNEGVCNHFSFALPGGALETTAFCIHGALHRSHARAACVMHTHMAYATALTLLKDGRLEPVSQNALRFFEDIAYDPVYNGLAEDEEEGARMADALGDKRVLFMANHGVMVVAPTIHQAFDDLYYLEQAARVQVFAQTTGKPLKPVTHNMAASTKAAMDRQRDHYARIHFEALKSQRSSRQSPEGVERRTRGIARRSGAGPRRTGLGRGLRAPRGGSAPACSRGTDTDADASASARCRAFRGWHP
jgi:ribulose-5-phosphate 4-epimerase/fuculose-1-phosphate aldolase